MKNIRSLVVFLAASLLTSVSGLSAQPGATLTAEEEVALRRLVELVRADVNAERTAIYREAMAFSADEAARFWPIYAEYQQEVDAWGDSRIALIREYAENFRTMTDEKARELIDQALRLEEIRTALKRRYAQRIGESLSPVVAARFLQLENRINLLIDLKVATEIPLIPRW